MKWFLRWTASYTSPNLRKSDFSPHRIQKLGQALDLYKQILLFSFLVFCTKQFHFVSNLSHSNLLENTIFSKHATSQKSVGDHHINDTFRLEQTGYVSSDIRRMYPSSAHPDWKLLRTGCPKTIRKWISWYSTVMLHRCNKADGEPNSDASHHHALKRKKKSHSTLEVKVKWRTSHFGLSGISETGNCAEGTDMLLD